MENNRKIKDVMMGMIEGKGSQGRPCREWLDDVKDKGLVPDRRA